MKKTILILIGIIAVVMITACPSPMDSVDPELSGEKEITAFSFAASDNTVLSSDVTGTISGTDIDLTVPYGTDVTALVASFTTTGESVTVGGTAQTSGTTANDFSSPVTYTVTAEDSSTKDYTVTVTIAANTAKEITAFSFAASDNAALSSDVTGTISGTDIDLTVPYGTDVTALVASFTTTGESVTVGGTAQTSGTTANDFSSPVTYTVTAEDGSTQDYTVTVTVADSTSKEITAFSFTAADNTALSSDVTGTISGTDIDLTVPYGTDVTALVASFTTTGTSVSVGGIAQSSGTTANDFSSPVTYTVTAADSSTQDYTVTVTIAANTAKEITGFSFTAADNTALSSDVTGTISGTDIDLTVPYGTDVTALVASFTTTGESVTVGGTAQTSGTTANDFSSPLTYTVTAADSSSQDYTVTVTIAANPAKEITGFSFTAADNAALSSDVTGTISGTDIDLTVPYGTDVTALVASFTTTGESVTVGGTEQTSGTTANDFSSPLTYTVTAADSSSQDYTVTVNITPPATTKEITGFSFASSDNTVLSSDVTGTISGTAIDLTVPYGTDVTALVASFTTTGESVTVGGTAQTSGTTANDFSSPVTYTVTAEDSSTQDYTVTVAVAAAASEGAGFGSATSPGDTGDLILAETSETITMVYAQDQASISFPTGTDDSGEATLTTSFWMAETEVTNAVVAAVLQWAYDEGWFSSSGHNELSPSTVKYGSQELLDLDVSYCRVDYDGAGTFSAESGYENNPVTFISWYGAIMVCNWLTEMRDGNTNNVVYTGIDTYWQDEETIEDNTKNGYRLPTSAEWEYTARYLGTTEPSTGDDLDTERLYGNDDASWTDGYYWTPGDYASGATADYNDGAACQAVAVYDYTDPDPYNDEQEVKSLGSGSENTLGLYDMSGNVGELCFTSYGSSRIYRPSDWREDAFGLQVGIWATISPDGMGYFGFRLCRTAD